MRAHGIVLLLALTVAGCGGRTTVPPDKVVGAIRSLPYDVRFRDVERPPGASEVVAGQLRDARTHTSVDFVVYVGPAGDDAPIVPRAGQNQGVGCAGATIEASEVGRDDAERDRMWRMGGELADAIFALAPGGDVRGLIALASTAILAGCGGTHPAAHHPSGPPVSPEALRRQIERSGLEIEWHDGEAGGNVIADLAGEARDRRSGGHISFEIAVARGRATVSMLGRSRYKLPASADEIDDEVNAVPRGVLRNLAYANWVRADDDSDATDRVSARLDQAILNAFPPTDAEAHPILNSPPAGA